MVYIILGVLLYIGGIIGVLIYNRIRTNAMTNYYTSRLYPYVGTNGEVRFTPFEIILDKKEEES